MVDFKDREGPHEAMFLLLKSDLIFILFKDLKNSVVSFKIAFQPDTRKQMRDIARNRKLAEIGRTQHNEISVLKNELERLRKKTFPALVKVTR